MAATSKISLATAAILALSCLPAGHFARNLLQPSTASVAMIQNPQNSTPVVSNTPPELSDAEREWNELHEQYGRSAEVMPRLYNVVSNHRNGIRRSAFSRAVMEEWIRLDPHGAVEHFRSQRSRGGEALAIGEWLKRDPDSAVASLCAAGFGDRGRLDVLKQVFPSVSTSAPKHLPTIAAQIPSYGLNAVRQSLTQAFADWAVRDQLAARMAAESLESPTRNAAILGIARSWGEQDPTTALKWAKGLSDPISRSESYQAVLLGWAKLDPATALNQMESAPAGGHDPHVPERTFESQMIGAAADRDFHATFHWMATHPGRIAERDLKSLGRPFIENLARDPAGTIELIRNLSPAAASAVLQAGFNQDGFVRRDAMESWLQTHPQDPFVGVIRRNWAEAMAYRDPHAVNEWINQQPKEALPSDLLASISERILSRESHTGLLDQLLQTSQPEWRKELLREGFRRLGNVGAHELPAWAARIEELPETTRAEASGAVSYNARGGRIGQHPFRELRGEAIGTPESGGRNGMGESDSRRVRELCPAGHSGRMDPPASTGSSRLARPAIGWLRPHDTRQCGTERNHRAPGCRPGVHRGASRAGKDRRT